VLKAEPQLAGLLSQSRGKQWGLAREGARRIEHTFLPKYVTGEGRRMNLGIVARAV